MLRRLIKQGINAVDGMVLAADRRKQAPDTLVNVMFHSVYESPAQTGRGELGPNQDVTVADFRGFVEEMLESGYTVVSPAQVDAGLAPGSRYLTITFDDGYSSVLAHGAPILAQYGFSATTFVVTGQCGKHNDWDQRGRMIPKLSLMGWPQLREWRAAGLS